MRWTIKNFVSGLILFPCNLILLQLLAMVLWRRRPRLAGMMMTAAVVLLAALSMPAVAVKLVEPIEFEVPALDLKDPELASRADAIVVLGAGRVLDATEYSRDVVSPGGLLRLRYAADIWRKTHKPVLVTGGVPDRPGPSEAALMADALKEEFSIRAKWLEEASINTSENAKFSYRILAPLGIRKIFLVTNASHMPRAKRSFERAGFTVVAAPMGYLLDEASGSSLVAWVPSGHGVEMSYIFFHEMIGALWYKLHGA